jgi:molecular chaperone DnaK
MRSVNTMGSGFKKWGSGGSLRMSPSVLRYEYAQIVAPLMELMMKHVQNVLHESHLTIDELDYVLPVGLATNTPAVKDFLRETFEGKVLPTANEMSAAVGAAMQASLLVNELRDYVVWDALTVPIAVQLPDGSCKTIIRRGTPLPITGYYQVDSIDGTINLNVLQGDSEKADENALLAELTINNCPPTVAVNAKVEVTFHVRADGTIEYSAQHIGLGVNLPVSVRAGERAVYVNQRWLTEAPPTHRKQDPKRLERLARKLNLSADVKNVYATLRHLGYDSASIADGTAVEKLIRALRRPSRKPELSGQ